MEQGQLLRRVSPPIPQLQQRRGRKAGLDDRRRRQARDDLVPHGDLVRVAGVFLKAPDEQGEPLSGFADGNLHGLISLMYESDKSYKERNRVSMPGHAEVRHVTRPSRPASPPLWQRGARGDLPRSPQEVNGMSHCKT